MANALKSSEMVESGGSTLQVATLANCKIQFINSGFFCLS
jgi:hypothetical protein